MANKVKGITIELSADASGIESALKNVNKELKTTQSQLNSVNKSLKMDPGNADLLEQKQRLLGQAVSETTKKLEALKAAQADIAKNGGAGSQSQYDALTREISDTEQSLKGLQSQQRATNTEFMQAQARSSAFGQALTTVGTAASQVAEKTRALSAAAAGALAAMAGMAVKAAQQADEWITLANQTGLSTDAIQKFAYVAEQIDVPLPTITSAITQLKRHLDDTSGIWQRIGIQVKDQSGNYRDIESIFNDTVKALGNIQNETERDEAAMKLFGKSANELAGLIDDGGKKMQALGQHAEDIGAIVSEDDLQALADFNDKLEEMKSRMSFAAMKAAVPIMEALQPIVNALAGALEKVAAILQKLPSPVVKILAVALILVAILAPIAMGISMVCSGLQALIAIIPMVGTAITTMATAMTTALAANPYITAIAVIILAIAALGFAVYEIVTHWDELKASTEEAWNAIKGKVNDGVDAIKGVGEKVINAFKGIPAAVKEVGEAFASLLSPVRDVITQIINKFNELKEKAFKMGKDMLKSFADGINSVISSVISTVQRLASSLSQIWNSITNDANRAGRDAGNAFAQSYGSSSSNIQRYTTTSFLSAPSVSPSYANASYSTGPLVSAMNNLSTSLNRYNTTGTSVNVELVGSAKNIFDTVRVQNNTLATATGYHALA